jgi:hypothetical protein
MCLDPMDVIWCDLVWGDISIYVCICVCVYQKFEAFTDLLNNTLCDESTRRVWCEPCGRYEISRHTRTTRSLPNVLSLHANVNTDVELDLWRSKAANSYDGSEPTTTSTVNSASASASASSSSSSSGFSISSAFPSSSSSSAASASTTAGAGAGAGAGGSRFLTRSAQSAMNAWLPLLIQIELDATTGKPKVTRFQPVPKPNPPPAAASAAASGSTSAAPNSSTSAAPSTTTTTKPKAEAKAAHLELPANVAVYQLSAVIAHVSDPVTAENTATHSTINGEHLVAHLHIPHHKVYGEQLCADRFYIFNDFGRCCRLLF